MIKAAIFDLNGIFLQSPKLSLRFEKDFGVPADVFVQKLSKIMESARKPGARPTFSYWGPVLSEWKINLSEKEFWDYWFKAETVSEKMVAFAKSLREKGIKVFILSNNFKERAMYYRTFPWLSESADKAYFSWETGKMKPDPEAWKIVLTENALEAKDCLYFDDQEKNVKAAESLGIEAYRFTNEAALEKAIQAHF